VEDTSEGKLGRGKGGGKGDGAEKGLFLGSKRSTVVRSKNDRRDGKKTIRAGERRVTGSAALPEARGRKVRAVRGGMDIHSSTKVKNIAHVEGATCPKSGAAGGTQIRVG